ncbi:MAG: nitroreductase family protein, partial [Tenericutes bacterium]|nr:nitroreductase family protein [Mycoplasmatota bacterium]
YSIIKVEDKDVLNTLSRTCDNQQFIKNASFALIFLVDHQRMYDYFSNNNYFSHCKEQGNAPQFPTLSDLLIGSEDAICAAQNSVIAAESVGVGSCYIGDIIENYEIHKELFNLQPLTFPLGMLVYGNYPEDHKPRIRDRYDSKYIVFNEKYKHLNKEELSDVYKDIEKRFVPNNRFNAKNAAQYLYSLKFGSDYAVEMRRSANVAYKEWIKYAEDGMRTFNRKFPKTK